MPKAEGITQRGARWYVAVRLGDGRMFRATFDTQREAISARDKARDDARAGRAVVDHRISRLTVGELAAAHLAGRAPSWSPGSKLVYASDWRALKPHWAWRRVVEVRASEVSDWFHGQVGAGYARNTILQRLNMLRTILDRATADLGIVNAARIFATPRGVATRRRTVRRYAYTPAQIEAVMAATRPRLRLAMELGLGLGLRSGELRGLTVDRVDFDTGRVRVDRQALYLKRHDWPAADRLGKGHGFAQVKTLNSDGVVWADDELLAMVRAHLGRYGPGRHGLLVTDEAGEVLTASQLGHEVARVRAATGLATFTPHDLRHTRGSWALEAGASIADVAVDLRHTVQTAAATYLHADEPTGAERTAAVMARARAASEVDARKPRARGHLRTV